MELKRNLEKYINYYKNDRTNKKDELQKRKLENKIFFFQHELKKKLKDKKYLKKID